MKTRMGIRNRIKTYTMHGGAWRYLETELINTGFSEVFASFYVSSIRTRLGNEHSLKALHVFDVWNETKDEKLAIATMRLLDLVINN